MRLFAGLTMAAVLIGSPCVAAQPEGCLPYEAGTGGSPVIRAMVEGQGPFAFVLDTASSGTTVDAVTAGRLSLVRDAETETAQGMGGAMDVKFHRVELLTAGPLALTDFVAPEIPPPDLDSHEIVGLAGVDLFGNALAVWNETPGCVTIGVSGTRPGGDGWRPVAVEWVRPWKIMIPIRIGSVEGLGLLDTGAQHTVLNPAFAARLGLTEESGRLVSGGEITGIDGRPMPLFTAEADDVSVGEWHWDRRTLSIGDLPVFSRLGELDAPLAIIGVDWLGDQAFAIDYGTQALWLRRSSSIRGAER